MVHEICVLLTLPFRTMVTRRSDSKSKALLLTRNFACNNANHLVDLVISRRTPLHLVIVLLLFTSSTWEPSELRTQIRIISTPKLYLRTISDMALFCALEYEICNRWYKSEIVFVMKT